MATQSRRCSGFSLVEVLVALMLIGLASSTLLLATASTVQSGNDAQSQTIARGIAEQLLDEIVGQMYHERGGNPRNWPLGPETGEADATGARILFDDSDDYAGYVSRPRDIWGIELGQEDGSGSLRAQDFRLPDDYFANWEVRVSVSYVDENDPTNELISSNTSVVRAIRIQVVRKWDGGDQELVSLRRVVAYVPAVRL